MGRATGSVGVRVQRIVISIHALRGESDFEELARGGSRYRISIHALREEGDTGQLHLHHRRNISIHALREEGDLIAAVQLIREFVISIHALREEGDHRMRLGA